MTTSRQRDEHVPTAPGPAQGGAGRTTPHGDPPRTLAEEFRRRPDAQLAALLRARPDLLSPVPGDLTQLATRAGTRASVVRALERLDQFTLQTAQALAVAPDGCRHDALRALLSGDADPTPLPGAPPAPPVSAPAVADALPTALATLRGQGLVWGDDARLRLVRTARELLTPTASRLSATGLGPTVAEATTGMSPGRLQELLDGAGLAPTPDPVTAVRALTSLFEDRPRLTTLLEQAPPETGGVLGRLVWGPPYGEVAPTPGARVRWLLDRGLLLPTGQRHVVLPREVALHLRGGRAHWRPEPVPPAVGVRSERRPQAVDASAAGQAHAALTTVEELLGGWGDGGPPVLRAGGLSVRDLKRTATGLELTEREAAFWLELSYAAGLLASDGDVEERFAATPGYDQWLRLPAEERWARLASSWLAGTRAAGLVGDRDTRGRTLAALGPGLDRSWAPDLRRRVLELLGTLPPGSAAEPESVLARLRWERPPHGLTGTAGAAGTGGTGGTGGVPETGGTSRAGGAGSAAWAPETGGPPATEPRDRLARWALEEAELLGITGRGVLTTHGRALLGLPPGTDEPPANAPKASGPRTSQTKSGQSGTIEPRTSAHPHRSGADEHSRTDERSGGGERSRAGAADSHSAAATTARGAADRSGAETRTDARHAGPPGRSPTSAERASAADHAARLLAPSLPEPLDHVLLQADLTAVAPGPLRRPLADLLTVLADVESRGGATVYRFSPASIRRALDAGHTAAELHALLSAHAHTPVPQPLAYLIDDVARKHGRLRVGAASCYLRCDDDALLGEILADRRGTTLGLRRLAPTVLAAQVAPDALLERLREMGYAPAAESATGDVLVARADPHRTPPRTPPAPVTDGPPVPDEHLLAGAVRAIRAGDRAASRSPTAGGQPSTEAGGSDGGSPSNGRPPSTTAADTLATMQAAALTGATVWIGYVNADGAASQRVLAPIRVEGGFVTGYDHTADEVRTYPLHRITGAAELSDETE